VASRMTGSADLYQASGHLPINSVNFVTCHDGFTLNDLVSYNEKHNEANGEGNNDGANDNNSWNHGAEGDTDDPGIKALRERQMKNTLAILLTSQGVPMILAGDEMGRTQKGNNNTYCHDSELNWQDWRLLDEYAGLHRFTSHLVAFRKAHPALRNAWHLRNADYVGSGYPDISWHGEHAWQPDWGPDSRRIAFMLCGKHARGGRVADDYIYVAINMHWDGCTFELPQLPEDRAWHVFANTGAPSPDDAWTPGEEPVLDHQSSFLMGSRSVAILVGRHRRG